ncbi:hypothetical protein HX882_23090 [Pseudomonas gingeri]|uniref:Uncharacterized protein n=1 Tax=Pseudomonas gingeri TaxID=117681 RepID=A0A7Y7XFW1_9PSED|nr:hypothetical protein [Pseudomonas gingeri]NWB98781.1 hypothetical protein [Pseudomonas gingeri]
MKVSINLRLTLGSDNYNVNLDLPGSAPSAESPFLFGVDQFKFKTGEDTVDETSIDKLLQVAIGDSGQLYVAVKPPKSLIQAAGVDEVVKNLEVLVAEGEYDPKGHKFKPKNTP